jgi:HSP20 family protein
MSTTRRAPRPSLTELALLQREVNQLFERLSELDTTSQPTAGEWFPSVDVYECRGTVMVVVEVPGLGPDSLRVLFRDRQLVISGERRERRPTPGTAAFMCMERPTGRFTRTIPLDLALDVRQAEARLQGGLLTVLIPRLKDRRGRETVIPVAREQDS